ncbi:hypothetical protein JTB14_033910 [Gonioctena quinquepunctata]|nr:hypothetical protein JTB14_033910 [Gonioctena quinquepunctata]
MVTWNANGLISKKDEPIDFLTDHNKDIVFLQETHLKNDHVGIPNYKIFRKGRLGRSCHWGKTKPFRSPSRLDSYYNTTDWGNFKLRSTTEYCAPESIESPDELDNILKKFEQSLKTFTIALLT